MDHVIDATKRPLGRLASRIAVLLQGKGQASYHPRLPGKDRVVVRNVGKFIVTGRKLDAKVYYRHTGYMGHLRRRVMRQVVERSPEEALRRTVYNMLPKNRLRMQRMKRLIIET